MSPELTLVFKIRNCLLLEIFLVGQYALTVHASALRRLKKIKWRALERQLIKLANDSKTHIPSAGFPGSLRGGKMRDPWNKVGHHYEMLIIEVNKTNLELFLFTTVSRWKR